MTMTASERETEAADNGVPKPTGPSCSRSALMVHGLGLAFAAVFFLLSQGLKRDFHAQTVMIAVGGASALALCSWSIVLAIKAIRRAEPAGWPLAVLMISVLETGSIGASLLPKLCSGRGIDTITKSAFTWGVPLWAYFALLLLLSAAVAWSRVRRAVKPAKPEGHEQMTREQRRRLVLRSMGLSFGLMFFLTFPFTLYLYCGLANRGVWMKPVVNWTPGPVKIVSFWLARTVHDVRPRWRWPRRILLSGRMPQTLLQNLVSDEPNADIRGCAWQSLARWQGKTALDIARSGEIGEHALTIEEQHLICHMVAWNLEPERQESMILEKSSLPLTAIQPFAEALSYRHPTRALVLLRDRELPLKLQEAMLGYVARGDSTIVREVWLTALEQGGSRMYSYAKSVTCIRDEHVRVAVVKAYLQSDDSKTRRLAVESLGNSYRSCSAECRLVLGALDDPDPNVMNEAAYALCRIIRWYRRGGGPGIPSTSEQVAMLRSEAAKWLKEKEKQEADESDP